MLRLRSDRDGCGHQPATTLREAAQAWLDGARDGTIRTRSGDRYKPAAVRTYEQALRLHVLDELGAKRLAEITVGPSGVC